MNLLSPPSGVDNKLRDPCLSLEPGTEEASAGGSLYLLHYQINDTDHADRRANGSTSVATPSKRK